MTHIDAVIDSEFHRVSAWQYGPRVTAALRDFVDDMAEAVETIAKQKAPYGPTGRLKSEGVIRTEGRGDSFIGDGGVAGSYVDPTAFAFGGGHSIRGGYAANRGQFSGVDKWNKPGHIFRGGITQSFYEAKVELNPAVPHAKWVHQGTGIYGPHHTPIVPISKPFLIFEIHGKWFELKSVRGQRAQPFLTDAFEYVRNFNTPAKLTELRAEIAAAT